MKQIEEVQRWFNGKMPCDSREHLQKVRTLLRQEDSDGTPMLQQRDSWRPQVQQPKE